MRVRKMPLAMWRVIATGAVLLLGLTIILAVGNRSRLPTVPRLVVLYAPCTVNRSFLQPYNPAVTYTPHLEAFARHGLVFTKHQTEEALSGIAYASLLSGNQAIHHGIFTHPERLDDSEYLISEAFRDGGYDVFLWADHDMASPELNYAQGVASQNIFWDTRRWRARDTQSGRFLRGDDPDFRQVLSSLRDDPDAKALLVTMFTVTHQPYRARHIEEFCHAYPDECAGLSYEDIRASIALFRPHAISWQYDFDATLAKLDVPADQMAQMIRVMQLLYKSNVYFLDALFGRVVDAIAEYGLLDQSLIVFTADHGERMYRANERFHWAHGYGLNPQGIMTPLIVRAPGIPTGRYDGVTRSIDVFPTVAGLAGIDMPGHQVAGADLSAAARREAPPPELVAFSHTGLPPKGDPKSGIPGLSARFPRGDPSEMWVGARRGDLEYKLTSENGRDFHLRVYDWEVDPSEKTDLHDPSDATQAAMVRQLGEYKAALVDAFERRRAASAGHLPNAREEEQLRALGYIK